MTERAGISKRWQWVALVGMAAFILGCVGYHQLFVSQGGQPSVTDVVYGSLSLFLFNPPPGTKLPVALDIARFVAPIAAGWAFVTAMLSLFQESAARIKLWRRKGHVVVCGLGFKGATFIDNLRSEGFKVVAIESNGDNPLVDKYRRLGVPVVIGDAQRVETLMRAKAGRAEWLLALCPDDAVNTEIVLSAHLLMHERPRGVLNCLAQISDPQLCSLLSRLELHRSSNWSVTFFNTDEVSADMILDRYPFHDGTATSPHILVAPLDPVGQRLVVNAAHRWRSMRAERPLVVTVVDDDAETRIRKLKDEYRILENTCTFIACSASDSDLNKLTFRDQPDSPPSPSRAYVTAFDDEVGVTTMLRLLHHDVAPTLVLAQSREYGKSKLLGALTSVEVFPVFERVCVPDYLAAVSIETLAQQIHEVWREKQQGGVEWDDPKSAEHRKSSRAQARDIPAKLRMLGYLLGPPDDDGPTEFTLSVDELERLAIHEHDRWNQERWDAGWTYAPGPKDAVAKTSPYLVPFESLPAEVAEWDSDFVRSIPRIVAAAGFAVRRLPTQPSPARDSP